MVRHMICLAFRYQGRILFNMFAFKVRIIFGLLVSLLKTVTVSTIRPLLLTVAILAVIAPLCPGLRWLELATTAVHPQDVLTFSITRSLVPVLLNSKVYSNRSPCLTLPKSCFSVWKVIAGSAHARAGKKATSTKIIFFICAL